MSNAVLTQVFDHAVRLAKLEDRFNANMQLLDAKLGEITNLQAKLDHLQARLDRLEAHDET